MELRSPLQLGVEAIEKTALGHPRLKSPTSQLRKLFNSSLAIGFLFFSERENGFIIIIIIIIILLLCEFFTLALADSFLLESKWQQVSSSLQDSS